MTAGQDRDRIDWLERLPIAQDRPWLALGATVAMVLTALGARVVLLPLIPTGMPLATFVLAAVITAFLFGVRFAILSTLLGGLLGWYFFIPDIRQTLTGPGGLPAMLVYALMMAINLLLFHVMHIGSAKLREQRERNAALAETREILFRELQHRVSNNLQVASALLSIQKKQVADASARAALDEAARRLGVIGRISRELYSPGGGMRNMHEFLEPLCRDVADAVGRPGIAVEVHSHEQILLRPAAAIPVALIVAEAVANAIEHGFAGRDEGKIDVELVRDGGKVRVEVHDDGHGPPPDFNLATHGSLGLNIAGMLAEQLDGSFVLIRGQRTTARLELPA